MISSDIVGDVIQREGGYSNIPGDRGGPTKYGITLATLALYRGHACAAADVAALAIDEARLIYEEMFIRRPGLDKINDLGLRALVFDWGVNSGTGTAIRALQRAVGAAADGALGSRTAAAVNAGSPAVVKATVLAARIVFYHELVAKDPTQAKFLQGWLNRCAEFAA